MIWQQAYLESRVMSAGPVELINILYEHALLSVQDARRALSTRDIVSRSKAISKTIAILGELERSLDHQMGGAIASNLARLYRYMRERLTYANLQQADKPLAEVENLLKTLGEGWEQISNEKSGGTDAYQSRTATGWSAPPMMDSMADHVSQVWSA